MTIETGLWKGKSAIANYFRTFEKGGGKKGYSQPYHLLKREEVKSNALLYLLRKKRGGEK